MNPPLRQRAALTLLALLLVVLAVVLLAGHRRAPRGSPTSIPAAPAPPLVLNAGHSPPPPPSTPPATQAQAVARTFLASYLPVLYGRRSAASIADADAHVRQSLQAANRPPRALADRHPHVTALVGQPQSSGSVLELATIADGVSAPYRIVFVVSQVDGAWRVTQLANY